jgi:hypothetical protein
LQKNQSFGPDAGMRRTDPPDPGPVRKWKTHAAVVHDNEIITGAVHFPEFDFQLHISKKKSRGITPRPFKRHPAVLGVKDE